MRVAIIGSRGYPYVYSGYETFVRELAERVVGKGHRVTVYCHRNLFKEYPVSVNGVDLVYIPTVEKKSVSQLLHSFQSLVHASLSKFDVILVVNSANGPFGAITRLLRKKTAINVDGLEWLRPKWKGLGARYFYIASKLATKLYDVIICDSVEMAKIYEEEFQVVPETIAYGADIHYPSEPRLIRQWNLEENGYYLVVGRMIPDNNGAVLLREFVQSPSEKKLVIVGDVPYKDKYALRVKQTIDPRVVFTGYIREQEALSELFHHSFAYLHGHEFGGTNPSMLQALANGCAVMALDTRFNREMCNNGEHALYFSKEPGSLANLMHTVEQTPQLLSKLKLSARQRILENYTWERITQQYLDLFQHMIDS